MNMSNTYKGSLFFLILLIGLSGLVIQGTNVSGESDGVTCVRHNPLVSIAPEGQSAAKNSTVYYNVTVENTDNEDCSASVFNLTRSYNPFFFISFSTNPLTIAPGAVGKVVMAVYVASYAPNGTAIINITATNLNSGLKGSAPMSVTVV